WRRNLCGSVQVNVGVWGCGAGDGSKNQENRGRERGHREHAASRAFGVREGKWALESCGRRGRADDCHGIGKVVLCALNCSSPLQRGGFWANGEKSPASEEAGYNKRSTPASQERLAS